MGITNIRLASCGIRLEYQCTVSSRKYRTVYPAIRRFKFCDRLFAQSWIFFMRYIGNQALDPQKNGLEYGALIIVPDHNKKRNFHFYTYIVYGLPK